MVNEKINILREKLHDLIEQGADFSEIQEVSVLLDECLIEYYNQKYEEQ